MQRSILRYLAALAAMAGLALNVAAQRVQPTELAADLGLQLDTQPVFAGQAWQLNRQLELEFDQPVDFRTVTASTIVIRTRDGVPARGRFVPGRVDVDGDGLAETLRRKVVVFVPAGPLAADAAGPGLRANERYVLTMPGVDTTANTVRSLSGEPFARTYTTNFTTPASMAPAMLYHDPVPGSAPAPVVRQVGSALEAATNVELGGDATRRIWLELDPRTGEVRPSRPDFRIPLNRRAVPGDAVSLNLVLDQPVDPSADNLGRVRLEASSGQGWRELAAVKELVSNDDSNGTWIRIVPDGLLPPDTRVRVVLGAGFRDLVGQASTHDLDGFASLRTRSGKGLADELFESFVAGGEESAGSLEDTQALFAVPRASWGGGRLSAGGGFKGTGGPGGDFDLVVRDGETLVFDTSSTQIVGGPDGAPTTVVEALGGVLDLNDLVIEEGGILRALGPNPVQILATGRVEIRGVLSIHGKNGADVTTRDAGNVPVPGGRGGPGGGAGGTASAITDNSTPRGGYGSGAFGAAGKGGQGGESGYAGGGEDRRRPGGGGGGRLADMRSGFQVEPGGEGHVASRGAISQQAPASGGSAGSPVFTDSRSDNDFFGVRVLVDEVTGLTRFVRGELDGLQPGAGGGAGGDAIPGNRFPSSPWSPATDERGGPGGGGAGALDVCALGPIIFGVNGQIRARGGRGGLGESTRGNNHIGGSGGGGSGGHVRLESATYVDFTDGGTATTSRLKIQATGGHGGDPARPGVLGRPSGGGDGGPGIIQIHVPDSLAPPDLFGSREAYIYLPPDAFAEGEPFDAVMRPAPYVLVPGIGTRSQARSKWVAIDSDRLAGAPPTGVAFRGLGSGAAGSPGDPQAPLLGPRRIGTNTAKLDASGTQLVLSGRGLDQLRPARGSSSELYLRTPELLKHFTLRLSDPAAADTFQDFSVSSATFDVQAGRLTLGIRSGSDDMLDFLGARGAASYTLIPRLLGRVTQWVGTLPAATAIRVEYQATAARADGSPDDNAILVDWTDDLSELPLETEFLRFQVVFDVDPGDLGLQLEAPRPGLEFLRIPYLLSGSSGRQ